MKFPRSTPKTARTKQVLMLLHFLAWWGFAFLLLDAGGILLGYILSCIDREANVVIYKNLLDLRGASFGYYTAYIALILAFTLMKAYILFQAIKAMKIVNLSKPFNIAVARLLGKISYTLIAMLVIAILHNLFLALITVKEGTQLPDQFNILEFLFMTGLIFIISKVFKRGVELQSEADLIV